jgi:hypothetical protein
VSPVSILISFLSKTFVVINNIKVFNESFSKYFILFSAEFSKTKNKEIQSYFVEKILRLSYLTSVTFPVAISFLFLIDPKLPIYFTHLLPPISFPYWQIIILLYCIFLSWTTWCTWISTMFCISITLHTPIIYCKVLQQLKYKIYFNLKL